MWDERDPLLWLGIIIGVLPWAVLLVAVWEGLKWLLT